MGDDRHSISRTSRELVPHPHAREMGFADIRHRRFTPLTSLETGGYLKRIWKPAGANQWPTTYG
jgi:hypothetical protein